MLEGTLKSITLRTDQGMERNFSSLEEGTNLKVPRFFRNVTPLRWRFLTLTGAFDLVLEFRRAWMFLTGAGVHDHVFDFII